MSERPFDVAVVGASIAGCTAARMYAQHGARVALIERRPSLDAYKTVCTHARELLPHHLMLCDSATGRRMNAIERALMRTAASDPAVASAFEGIGSRREKPWTILRPATLARIARAAAA